MKSIKLWMMAAILTICVTAGMNAQNMTAVDKKLSSDIRSAMVAYHLPMRGTYPPFLKDIIQFI